MGADLRPNTKIQELEALAGYARTQRNLGQSVVHCHGDFDRLDLAELVQFREAKALGDVLIVTVSPGPPGRQVASGPTAALSENCRAERVAAVKAVDFVAISRWGDAAPTVKFLAPSVYVPSPCTSLLESPAAASRAPTAAATEHTATEHPAAPGPSDSAQQQDVRENDCDAPRLAHQTVARPNGPTPSKPHAAEKSPTPLPPVSNAQLPEGLGPDAMAFLQRLAARYGRATILRHLGSLRPLRVALVGEAIIDEYVYCDALGKSGKEPVLAMRYVSSERHAGGALAIANHLADYCQTIDLFTYLGDNDSQEDFVREQLARNVFPTVINKAESPTIVKRRFVDAYSRSKMFAVYDINDEALSPTEEDALCAAIEARIAECDLVIVADFGHGLITEPIVELLCSKARFLAVNTQLNAANMGYHTISKYPRADFVSIHEGEIRLDSRSRTGDLRLLIRHLADQLACRMVMVTRGKHGSLLYHRHDGFLPCPAFATRIVDRVGAGDAVFALASLCAARGVPGDVLGFLGNVVGAEAVSIVGNRASIDRRRLTHALDALLAPLQNDTGAKVA